MASLKILNPVFSSISISHPNFPGKSDFRKKNLNFSRYRSFRSLHSQASRVYCATQEGDTDSKSNSEEPPESLFMKELKRRGMAPTSLLDDAKITDNGLDKEMKVGEEAGNLSKRKDVSAEFEQSLSNQRERSVELTSEGLEALVPRAKLLLTIGGTFFLGFWPLILSTVAFFSALYFYFGPTFIHDASKSPISAPQYIDPYALLEDEKIFQTAPRVN